MAPARLDHADFRIGEKMNGALEQVRLGHEIGIQDTNKFAISRFEPDGESACFEPGTIDAVNQLDVEAALAQLIRTSGGQLARIIGRVVQHLDLKTISRIIEFADRAKEALHHVNLIKNWQLHRDLRQSRKLPRRNGFALPVLEKEVDDEVTMNSVSGKTNQYAQVADRPDKVSEASLHWASASCLWLGQQGRHHAGSGECVNSKMPVLPLKKRSEKRSAPVRNPLQLRPSLPLRPTGWSSFLLSILLAVHVGFATTSFAQDEPLNDEPHQREELGVNPYTAPSIARIFQQLDELKPLSYEQLRRQLPETTGRNREEKALIFGGLIADGFLTVEAEKQNLVEDFGRILMREARGLGVAEHVTRHSASLTELGRRGAWPAVRKELIATQADVEQAMIELRDQKMAHLISLGGWLRGLEMSAGAVELNFSPQRANVLAQQDLVDYFVGELKTLPPAQVRTPFFEKIRAGVSAISVSLSKAAEAGFKLDDVKAIRTRARELNLAIRESD